MAELDSLVVSVQKEDFDIDLLQRSLSRRSGDAGAVATFTGYVREDSELGALRELHLEHYSGMTEKAIVEVLEEASSRWDIMAASVVHRIGSLRPGDKIVWVGVSARHRGEAFSACEFAMDFLKTRAPFWKKELAADAERWVSARDSDTQRARRWNT